MRGPLWIEAEELLLTEHAGKYYGWAKYVARLIGRSQRAVRLHWQQMKRTATK